MTYKFDNALPSSTNRKVPPLTTLSRVVRRLVSINASFEPETPGNYLCGTAEWHFFHALDNPDLEDGRKDHYTQSVIYTHNGKPKLITKGEPHGKSATIVCDEIPGDTRFTTGMMGVLYNRYGNKPIFKQPKPGIVVREVNEGMKFNIIRPSTFVAFPPEVRSSLLNDNSEISDFYAEPHRTKSIDDLRISAEARVLSQPDAFTSSSV